MLILTPSGYRDIDDCKVGDPVCAFDIETGAPIINYIEKIEPVILEEWQRWWNYPTNQDIPKFTSVLVNGKWTLFREQSIWTTPTTVKHGRDLVPGDTIYDDEDNATIVLSVEEIAETYWTRVEISGDHSFIADGLTLHNASRFCRPGAGSQNWTTSNTGCWAATTNGATGSSVPGSADTVTCDGNFGGGTIVLAFGGTITVQSITMGAMIGTFDNSVNNNNVVVTASGAAFSGTGTAARIVKLGTANYTLNNTTTATFTFATTTSLTLTASGATIQFSGAAAVKTFTGGLSQTYGTLIFDASSGVGRCLTTTDFTVGTLTITAPNYLVLNTTNSFTVSTAINLTGTSANQIGVVSDTAGSSGAINIPASQTAAYCSIRDVNFGGNTLTANNSFNLGHNSGATITAPSSSAPLAAPGLHAIDMGIAA